MNAILRSALAVAGVAIATQTFADVTFYQHKNFEGRSFNTVRQVADFKRLGINDRASSVVVDRDWWQVCEDVRFGGRCVVLRPGRYPSLAAMGLNNRISSVRIMDTDASQRGAPYPDAPDGDKHQTKRDKKGRDDYYDQRGDRHPNPSLPAAPYDYQRRYNEQTYEAKVTSVRAVVGPPEQRCWVERQDVVQDEPGSSVPGAIIGAVIGGVLGHQIGGGSGQDLATAGGVVAGAVVGGNISRDQGSPQTRNARGIQHCAKTTRYARPEYWDVTYIFRGQEHHVQTTGRPGATLTVNRQGEPRL